MTTNLLTPRVRVALRYPGSPFRVGDILTQEDRDIWIKGDCLSVLVKPYEFPAIFQPLKWHEFRAVEDMPQYLKDCMIGKVVVKVHEYLPMGDGFISEANTYTNYASPIDIFLPATEAEYLEYKNSKQI